MEALLLAFVAFLSLANAVLLYFLGTYVVRMNEDHKRMLAELVNILGQDAVAPSPDSGPATKSWDQKYEEELEAFARRMRYDSGLLDIDGKSIYSADAAANRGDLTA